MCIFAIISFLLATLLLQMAPLLTQKIPRGELGVVDLYGEVCTSDRNAFRQ